MDNLSAGVRGLRKSEELREGVRGFGRWSLVIPIVIAVLFVCGRAALVEPCRCRLCRYWLEAHRGL